MIIKEVSVWIKVPRLVPLKFSDNKENPRIKINPINKIIAVNL